MNDCVVKVDSLTKVYLRKTALDSLSFSIEGHGITGLIGRNGSGKTTLMKLCAGQLNKTGGSLQVFGEDPMDNLQVLSQIVYTYHDLIYERSLKLKNILQNYHIMFPFFDHEFATKLLKYFKLHPDTKYTYLSRGMTSTFNFICGLACRAPLTMMDEPFLGMDITVRKEAYEILLRESYENPRTFIISSHLLAEIETVLTHVFLIDKGRLVLHDNIDELRQSAYMLEGDAQVLERFCQGKEIIWRKNSEISNAVAIQERISETVAQAAKAAGLHLTAVRLEDLCIFLTQDNKEEELECLWQKTK